MDAMGALRTCYMAEDDIMPYADHYVMSTERHPMDHLVGELARRAWAGGRCRCNGSATTRAIGFTPAAPIPTSAKNSRRTGYSTAIR